MTHADLKKLLGGYAAGTLTAEERSALFEAAAADQSLFEAIADEEALREVLADPACRARVLSALDEPPPTVLGSFDVWLRRHSVWALAAAGVAAAVVLTVVVARSRPVRETAPVPRQIAMATKSVPAPVAVPASTLAAKPRLDEHRVLRAPAVAAAHAPSLAAPAFAPPAARRDDLAANVPAAAPALAASRRQLAARLGPAGAGAGGAIAPPPPGAAKPASANESVTVVSESEGIVPAEAAPAAPTDALEKKDERSQARVVALARVAALDAKDKVGSALGLRYTLLRRGADGKDTEVPPDTPFSRGESVRLRIEAGQNGYLSVLSGKRLLFAGPVVAGQPVLIETKRGLLHLVLLPQPDSGPLSTLVSRARQHSGIVTDVAIASR